MRTMIALAVMLCLSGCGDFNEALESHDGPIVKKFEVKDVDTFLIADDIREERIIISMSSAAVASAALNNIFTFGTSYPDAPESLMKSAAISYLKSTSRDCNITERKELSRMRWEFRYQCQPVSNK